MKSTRKWALITGMFVMLIAASFFISRSSRERMHAIPPRGGESLMVSAIPTANYLQRDPQWADDTIAGSNETLARVGCTVCSLAMALDHYGIKITPKRLNDYLKTNAGYTDRGWLKWDSVSSISEGKVTLDYIGKPTFQRIDAALTNGQPVIGKVFVNEIVPHWVLIVGKENTEYLIRDPLGDGRSLRQLSHYRSGLYAIRILKASR
jgi:hypothetical protein